MYISTTYTWCLIKKTAFYYLREVALKLKSHAEKHVRSASQERDGITHEMSQLQQEIPKDNTLWTKPADAVAACTL